MFPTGHLYTLLYYLLFLIVKSEPNLKRPEQFEDFPPSTSKIPLHQEKYRFNISKYHDAYIHNIGYYNVTKEIPINIQNHQYLKGYSLRIPKIRLFQNVSVPNMYQLEQEIRTKRGVAHLYNMISCATGCNPLSYKGYGCFCGLLGSGTPVDGIDRCCKTHDWCYDAAKCPMYLEYFVPYYWKCLYNRPFCALDHGDLGAPGSCADKLCECDRALSECLKRYSCPVRRTFCKSSPFRLLQNVFMLLT